MSRQTRPVCAVHGKEMEIEKNDYRVLFMANFGPYIVQSGDLWRCPEGGETVVIGWGDDALSEHFQNDFETYAAKPDLVVSS